MRSAYNNEQRPPSEASRTHLLAPSSSGKNLQAPAARSLLEAGGTEDLGARTWTSAFGGMVDLAGLATSLTPVANDPERSSERLVWDSAHCQTLF